MFDSTTKSPTRREFMAASIVGWVGAAAGLSGVVGPARAAGTSRWRGGGWADEFLSWQELAPGVHTTSGLSTGGNSLAVSGREASLLVDCKYPGIAPALRREAETRTAAPLAHVVNTHHHADHSGGNVTFTRDLELIAFGPATDRIVGQHDRYMQMLRGAARQIRAIGGDTDRVLDEAEALIEKADSLDPDRWKPTRTLTEHDTKLDLGGLTAEIHHMGHNAHTDNDIVVFIPERNVLHTGDLVFHGLHPFFDPSANVSCTGWTASLVRLLSLCDHETVVVPGHGEITDRRGIEGQLRYLTQLWESVAGEVEAGTPREQAVEKSWAFMEGLGFAQIRSRAIGATYDEITRLGS